MQMIRKGAWSLVLGALVTLSSLTTGCATEVSQEESGPKPQTSEQGLEDVECPEWGCLPNRWEPRQPPEPRPICAVVLRCEPNEELDPETCGCRPAHPWDWGF